MPGMPQGRDINEAGPKSVTLVTIGDDRKVHVEERITSLAQFERVDVDLSGIEDWRDMVGEVARALERRVRRPSPTIWSPACVSPARRRSPGACVATSTC